MLRKLAITKRQMRSENPKIVENAKKSLKKINFDRLRKEELEYIIKASAEVSKEDNIKSLDLSHHFAKVLINYQSEVNFETLKEYFSESSSWSKSIYLNLLSSISTEESLELMKTLIEDNLGTINDFVMQVPINDYAIAEILYPSVIEYSNDLKIAYSMNCYIIDTINLGIIELELFEQYLNTYLKKYEKIKTLIKDAKKNIKNEYNLSLNELEDILLTTLDVLSNFTEKDEIQEIMKENINNKNLEIKMVAVKTLMSYKIDFDIKKVYELCKNKKTRSRMFQYMEYNDLLIMFPQEYMNQEALAESEMNFWLTAPSELGDQNIEIEFIEAIKRYDENMGEVKYYMYRFRIEEEQEWMIGFSGYYVDSHLSATPYFATYSNYELESELTLEKHLDSIIDALLDGGIY